MHRWLRLLLWVVLGACAALVELGYVLCSGVTPHLIRRRRAAPGIQYGQ